MDMITLLESAPQNFAIQDSLTKAWSMLNKFKAVLCDIDASDDASIVAADIIKQCDFFHNVTYKAVPGEKYDLIIGNQRLDLSPYTNCAENGRYRPVFWYADSDLQEYLQWMEERNDT